MDKITATFHLSTANIFYSVGANLPAANASGSINALQSDYTWNNINMRTILGEMYDDYDIFNLSLTSVSYGLCAVQYGLSNNDWSLSVNMSGLPFINSTYNTFQNSNTSSTQLSQMAFNGYTTVGSLTYQSSVNSVSFQKPPPMVNLRVFLTRIDNTVPQSAGGAPFPPCNFYFHVYGIKKERETK